VPLGPPGGGLGRRAGGLGRAPAGDEVVGVDQADVDGRADGDAPPLDDAPVELGGGLADLRLGAELPRRLRQPLHLPPQPQRGGQHLLGGHALPAGVIAQPRLPVVTVGGTGPQVKRLAGAGQVVEHTAPLGVGYLLVDPGAELHLRRLALGHH
jgi:hypothetical protein